MGWETNSNPAPFPDNIYSLGDLTAVRVLSSVHAGYDETIVEEYYDEIEAIPTELLHGYSSDEFLNLIISENDTIF